MKTYLLVFRPGQEVMSGLSAFARKHRLVAGHLTVESKEGNPPPSGRRFKNVDAQPPESPPDDE